MAYRTWVHYTLGFQANRSQTILVESPNQASEPTFQESDYASVDVFPEEDLPRFQTLSLSSLRAFPSGSGGEEDSGDAAVMRQLYNTFWPKKAISEKTSLCASMWRRVAL